MIVQGGVPPKTKKTKKFKQIINFRSFLLKSQNHHNFRCHNNYFFEETQIVEKVELIFWNYSLQKLSGTPPFRNLDFREFWSLRFEIFENLFRSLDFVLLNILCC